MCMGVQVYMPACGERARCMWGDTCTWVCVCVYGYVCAHVCMWGCAQCMCGRCMYMCVYEYVCEHSACGGVLAWNAYTCECVCVDGHVCMWGGEPGVCGWGCMHVFMCVYVCTHTCEHMCLLGIKSRALLMLGNYSISGQPPQHRNFLCLTVLKSRKIVYILSYC